MDECFISQPSFVHHDKGQILSIDCHPSGTKFLTCGQKGMAEKGFIVVWNMAPALDKSKCLDEKVPQVLYHMEASAQANVCRWSPDGKKFALGFDDSSVSVRDFAGSINSAGTIGGHKNVEMYKELCTMQGHRMEVLAVEWSPDGRYLASGSLDHRIIIYNARKLPNQITVLTDCQLAVKGLAWDPIGKYLASLEGDKKLRLWTTDSWQCVTSITKPFESTLEETLMTRMDWTPDGKYLMVPAASQKGQHLVQLVQRQSWNCEKFFAGPLRGTSCVRSMPRLTEVTMSNGSRKQLTVCAIGSRDKAISVWIFPGNSRPILVVDKLFKHTVMDFSWCGRNLLACSSDGSVKIINFSEEAVGNMISKEAMSDLCHQIYSIRPPQYETEAYEADENTQDSSFSLQQLDQSITNGNSLVITCPEDVINNRKKQEQAEKTPSVPMTPKTVEIDKNPRENEAKEREKRMLEERSKQITAREPSGKKRIQPVFCGGTAATSDEPSTSSGPSGPSGSSEPPAKRALVAPLKPTAPVANGEVDLEESSDSDDDDDDEDMETSDVESRRGGRKRKAEATHPVLTMDFKKPVLRPMEPKTIQAKDGTVLMEAPEPKPTLSLQVLDAKSLFVEVDNQWKHRTIETTQIKLMKVKKDQDEEDEPRTQQECIWITVVASPVIIGAANKHHVMVGCGDKCIRVYRTTCGTHTISLRLDSLPVWIGVRENAAFALTETGRLSTWNLKTNKAIVARQSLADCIEATVDNSLLSVEVSETGVPLIVFSNGSIFIFHVSLSCWIQAITENNLGRLATSITDAQLKNTQKPGPLVRVLKRMRKQTTAESVAPQIVKAVKESQLEQLLNCAEQLGNAQDYKTILMLYVEALCEGGSEKKLQNVLMDLTKSVHVCGRLRSASLLIDVTKIIKSKQPGIAEKILAGATVKTKTLF